MGTKSDNCCWPKGTSEVVASSIVLLRFVTDRFIPQAILEACCLFLGNRPRSTCRRRSLMVPPCLPIRPVLLLSAGVSALQRQFRTSAYWSIRQLVCEIDREHIVLRGTLPSYY